MILEQRDYGLVPGGVPRYLDAWHRLGRASQVRHLGEPFGVYAVEVGRLNTLIYLWSFADLAARTQRRSALAADPDFARFRGEVRDLVLSQENRILVAVAPPQPEFDRGELPPGG